MSEITTSHFRSGLTLEDGGKRLEGYAIVYEQLSDVITEGGRSFREIIKRGAATEALRSKDIRAIYEHDPRQILGRTSSGTLRLKEDDNGVFYSIDLANTPLGHTVREMVTRRDVAGASFEMRFLPADRRFYRANGEAIHEISTIRRLPEITITSGPAYPQTSAVLRSLVEWEEQEQKQQGEQTKQVPLIVRYRLAYVEGM